MTRIGTPSPGIIPTSLTQGAPNSALLAQLPATLSDIALGTFLTGTVLDRAPNGLTMLQTPGGIFGLKTTVPLPPGSTVTLQIQTAGAQLQAIVLSVTPQAQGGPTAPMPGAAAPVAQPPAGAAPNAPATPPSGTPQPAPHPSTLVATVIGPAGGPVPTAGASTAAPALVPQGATQPQAAATAVSPPGTAAASSAAVATVATTAQGPFAATASETPQTVLPNAQQPSPTVPAAAQAAYQRQLNAVPAAPLPTPAPPQPQTAPTSMTAAPALLAQEAGAAKPVMPDVAPLPTGTQVQVRLLPSLMTPQAAAAPAPDAHPETAALLRQTAATAGAHPNPVIMATVVARTPAGQVILDSAVGRLLAPLPRDGEATAPGARLLLELIMGERGPTASRAGAANSGLAALARNWASLKDAMTQLQDAPGQQEPYAALERALPKAGPRLAQQMLSYLDAAQTGLKAWLGETVTRALATTGGQRMLEQLDRDLREMQMARQANEGDWRMTLVPLLDGQHLRQIRFFERRRKQEAERKKEEPARFVVECDTSAHGAIQLDGLMHEKRIDLIVRSHEPLPADMEHDILVLFGETCTGLDLTGQLFFQAMPAFPVHPADDLAKEPLRVSV